jgi:hypothetical protein
MTITINLAPELQAELVRQAAMRGVELDAYAASLIANAARLPHPAASQASNPEPPREVREAIETLKSFGKTHRLSLGGTTIRELRNEARP